MDIKTAILHKRLYFDGGTGTVLQGLGLAPGERPEDWNLSHPDVISKLHKNYLEAGADIIKTNTFGVNSLKYENPEKHASEAVKIARHAADSFGADKYVAYDIGPTGKIIGSGLTFEEAVEIFGQCASYAEKYGADLILIETMNDIHETKAALLAAKERSSLPVFVTNVFDESGRQLFGTPPLAMIAMLEGMGADAIGLNCSVGPDKMISIAKEYAKHSSLPLIVNPNAGMPAVRDGKTVYDISPELFAELMAEMAEGGACILGGCCGTTPEYIRKTVEKTSKIPYRYPDPKNETVVSSATETVVFGISPVLIGERINPTGKKKIKEALRSGNYDEILSEGVKQSEMGAHMLDVNAGLPEIDEAEALYTLVTRLQEVTQTPLQIDTANPAALEKAMRAYIGKPLINSVNGSKKSMDAVFPLVKKYGGAVIALTMDEGGIPETAEGRLAIAEKILFEAEKYNLTVKDIIFDPLTLAVSADESSADVTIEAIRLIRERLGAFTSLGVSNVSFGLPERDKINSVFFGMALSAGLSAAIMNPFSTEMMNTYHSYRALKRLDPGFAGYIAYASDSAKIEDKKILTAVEMTLHSLITRGLKSAAGSETARLLDAENQPMDIINRHIIPALNEIGNAFAEKRAYLPQLLMSADAASAAFAEIKKRLPSAGNDKSRRIVMATVQGDIHDIGKNIVCTLLENFGFYVEDLGKDVAPETVARAAVGCRLVGLSALMTTTVPAMEQTIKEIRKVSPDTKVIVGGAVLNREYADSIGADFYAEDAIRAVRIAEKVFGEPQI